MNRKLSAALIALVVTACGGDGGITSPSERDALLREPTVLALGVDSVTGASIETNKDDYSPGEVVHLVGRGWSPNETVNLHMTEEPNTHADVDTNVVADAAGGFSIHFYDVQPHDLGVTFTLTATGHASQSVAVAIFTDGSVSLSSTSPVSGVVSRAITVGTACTSTTFVLATSLTINAGNSPSCVEVRAPTSVTLGPDTYTFSGWSATLTDNNGAIPTTTGIIGPNQWLKFQAALPSTNGAIVAQYTAPNSPPSLTGVPVVALSIPELVLYTFDANATDPGSPPQTLTFSLQGTVPTGAAIDATTGVFTWTPTEAQGPSGPHTLTVRVSDGTANTDQSVTINVTEVNAAPVLQNVPATATIGEEVLYTFDANATDSDLPAQTLVFSLQSEPAGATINSSTGVFTWTPTEAQGPNDYTFDVRVSDGLVTTTQSVTLTVSEANTSPVLTGVPSSPSIPELVLYTFDADATDADTPAQTLTFSLIGAPAGATINSLTGVFSWTPSEAQGPGNYPFTVRVSDGMANTDAPISITVTEVNVAPVLVAIGNRSGDELTLITFTATATDADLPGNALTYSLQGTVPSGAAITAAGVFTWTPTEVQGPGDYLVTVRVTDDGTPNLWNEETISIHINEVNVAPVLAPIGSQSGNELTLITFDASATDADFPTNTLTFSLGAGAPAGATIDGASGVFSWTPTEAQGPSNPSVTVCVTDNGAPTNLQDCETIAITVAEVNVAPLLASIGDKSINEGSELTFAASATDADLPPNALTYSLVGGPAGATINGSTGAFSWTPTDGPTQTATFVVRVTDDGTPAMSDEEEITVTVNNVAPNIYEVTGEPTGPVPAGTVVTLNWKFTDPGSDAWTCEIEWDVGVTTLGSLNAATKTCSATKTLTAGLYTVTLKVSDDDGGVDTEGLSSTYIVVYDPTGGFVTGGGWITSPTGAYVADPTMTGKATFGFVSKYERNKTLPQGNTEFNFHAASFEFKSTAYEWLVVAGTRAQYKGAGTITGQTGTYGFLLTAVDGGNTSAGVNPDKFRIKIWQIGGSVVYDNQISAAEDSDAATGLSGGSIVIHTKK